MSELDDNYTFYLQIYFKSLEEPCDFKIRKRDSQRFKNNLESYQKNKSSAHFFIGDTLEGKCVGINLAQIQAIRLLWEPSSLPEEENYYEGPIKIFFLNRESPVSSYTESPDILCVLYSELEHGPEVVGDFVNFIDEDGEEVIINMNELLYIECPKSLATEGWEMIRKEDDIDA